MHMRGEKNMHQHKTDRELKTLVIYWSATGNTEKVASAIQKALVCEGGEPFAYSDRGENIDLEVEKEL